MSVNIDAVLKNIEFLSFVVLILFIVNVVGQVEPELNSLQFTPQENGYTLRITLPDGSQRDEIMELKNPDTPQQYISVMGTNFIYYCGSTAMVTYTADKNGYLFKYIFQKKPTKIFRLGTGALKASAG